MPLGNGRVRAAVEIASTVTAALRLFRSNSQEFSLAACVTSAKSFSAPARARLVNGRHGSWLHAAAKAGWLFFGDYAPHDLLTA